MASAEMNDSTKRKEPEAETEKAEEVKKPADEKAAAPEAPKIAVVAKPGEEPATKKLKTASPDAALVRKQVEYYLSDENLKFDQFFHEKISTTPEGWLELNLVLSCNKVKAMRATKEDVLAALKDSKIEVKDDGLSIRRPANLALPALEKRPDKHQKKGAQHAHDGGVIAVIKAIPEEQSWMQIKSTLRGKLPDKVQIWFVSEVSDKNTCIIASAPFENDVQFFEELELEVGGAKLKTEVAQGDSLQQCLKVLPKHIKDKRDKESRKKQKERNRPIVVGGNRFVNVSALRSRVKEILNSRSDGEALKVGGGDYKLIKALLGFHPKGEEKSKGMVGIKVGKSGRGDSRCLHMVKEDGKKEEDFSAQKCLNAIEANPPYVAVDTKEESKDPKKEGGASPAKAESSEAPKAEEKKDDTSPAKAESSEAPKKEEEKKDVTEKKEEAVEKPAEDKKEDEKMEEKKEDEKKEEEKKA